jgi:hypothetical protein
MAANMAARTELIEIIVGEGLSERKESYFGHMAISINGTVYSQVPGAYETIPHVVYIQKQGKRRSSRGFVLRVTPEEKRKIETELIVRAGPNAADYGTIFNNCTTSIVRALKEVGIVVHDPRFNLFTASPVDFMIGLQRSDRLFMQKSYPRLKNE